MHERKLLAEPILDSSAGRLKVCFYSSPQIHSYSIGSLSRLLAASVPNMKTELELLKQPP